MTFGIVAMTISIKCHYAECHNYFYVMLTVVLLNSITLSDVMLNVVLLNVVAPQNKLDLFSLSNFFQACLIFES